MWWLMLVAVLGFLAGWTLRGWIENAYLDDQGDLYHYRHEE